MAGSAVSHPHFAGGTIEGLKRRPIENERPSLARGEKQSTGRRTKAGKGFVTRDMFRSIESMELLAVKVSEKSLLTTHPKSALRIPTDPKQTSGRLTFEDGPRLSRIQRPRDVPVFADGPNLVAIGANIAEPFSGRIDRLKCCSIDRDEEEVAPLASDCE